MKPPCVVLAGGRSSRMGGRDKSLLPFRGEPMLAHVLRAVAPQSAAILINANGDPARFAGFGLPVRCDVLPGFEGPLAGLLTAMHWARDHVDASHVLSVPCDTPFLPPDLAVCLTTAMQKENAVTAIARDRERVHPTIGLWPVALAERLADDLRSSPSRAIYRWLSRFAVVEVMFPAGCFRNINTPEDLALAG